MTEPALDRRVFAEMLREEWRLHGRLFGGRRFAAFPPLVALLAAGAVWLLVRTGTAPGTVVAGVHALAFAFGLHTGSLGFVGRDALRNLLGDRTLVVFSARTLPVSRRRLLGLFVLKDVAYYAVLFLAPLAVAFVPAALAGDTSAGAGTVAAVLSLWVTLTATFALGIGVTFAAIGLSTRGVPGVVVLLGLGAAVGLLWAAGADVAAYTPYGVFVEPTAGRAAASLGLVAVLVATGLLTYDAGHSRPARTAGRAFRRWRRRLPADDGGLTAKSLLDVWRSSGGVGKVAFSGAVLFAVSAALIDLAGTVTGARPSTGVSFGAVLGLSAFTTYNWLTQFDDVEAYLVYPVAVADVFRAKARAFALLGFPTGLAFYALALVWRGAAVPDALAGLALLVGVEVYVFGVTVSLAGLSPNEFLFDSVLFAAFALAVSVPLVPVLVVGFVLPLSTPLLAGMVLVGVVLGALGVALFRRSLPKWERVHRAA